MKHSFAAQILEETMGQIEVNSDNFYEELPIGVMRVHPDPEARILMANRAAAQMFGYASVEELLQVPGGELMENPSVRAALMEELAAGGGVLGKEVRLKRRDGSPVWVSVRAKAVHSEGGEIQYIEAVAIDITRQKQVEESLRNSEARFRAIFESTAESIVVYDKDCNYLYANQAAIDHVGTSRDKVVGKNIRDGLGHIPDLMHLWRSRVEHVFATEEPMHVEDQSVIGDRVVWSESTVSPIQDDSGKTLAVGIAYRDVSDRKLAEQALRESEEKYRALAERMNDIPYSMNAQGMLTYIGPQVARYALSPEDVTSKQFLDFLVPEDRDRVARDFQETMSTGREFPTEFRITNRGGQVYWLEDHGKAQRDATGRIVGMTGVLRDITERKQAEEALRVAHRRLVNAREEERKRLARDLHDAFGQTLIAMRFGLENVRKEHASTVDQPMSEALTGLSERCGELIQDVRQMSYGLYPATLEQFGVAAAIRQLTSICGLAKVNATVRCSKAAEHARFPSDVEIAVFRIAQEAVNNALRHARCEQIEVKLGYSRGRLVLRILDDGVGFDPEEAVGKGLGLTSMHERAQAVSGELRIASRPGQTRLELHLPIQGP